MAGTRKTPEPTPEETEQPTDAHTDEVQAKVDEETSQGFRGVEVDATPNDAYTVSGVTSGAPTPETDKDTARKATEHLQ
jgi:hypothetical protein